MKNIKLVALFAVMLLFSGCMKSSTDITVNSDGSVDYNYTAAISKKTVEDLGEYADDDSGFNPNESLTEEDRKEIEEKGFKIEAYDDGEYSGYKINKHFDDIAEVSSTEEVTYSTDLSDGDNIKIFTVKEGFFKNTYTAKIKYDEEKESYDSIKEYNIDEYAEYFKGLDLSFNITLPKQAKSNNATSVDGNKYTWNLIDFDKDYIEFEFEMVNTKNIIICVVAVIAIAAIICGVVLSLKKKKTN